VASPRLSLALASGEVSLPDGPVVMLNAPSDVELDGLDGERLLIEQDFYPDFKVLEGRGLKVCSEATGAFGAAIVYLPRAKAAARALIGRANALTGGGLVLVDGQKTDGIVAMIKALRGRAALEGSLSKAHGKLAWFSGGDFADWQDVARRIEGGFLTRAGVFSADAPDKGSVLLAEALAGQLSGQGADLGAGWGYLGRAALAQPAVSRLHLVEASHTALACARENIDDPRATFHWADARHWRADQPLDFVITNPPFHTGRKGEPELGRAFIRAGAAMLAAKGQLFLVANRHLPYEGELAAHFRKVEEIAATPAFKLFHATNPRRSPVKMR